MDWLLSTISTSCTGCIHLKVSFSEDPNSCDCLGATETHSTLSLSSSNRRFLLLTTDPDWLNSSCVTLSSRRRYLVVVLLMVLSDVPPDTNDRMLNVPLMFSSISLKAWNCSASRLRSFSISASDSSWVNANCSDIRS